MSDLKLPTVRVIIIRISVLGVRRQRPRAVEVRIHEAAQRGRPLHKKIQRRRREIVGNTTGKTESVRYSVLFEKRRQSGFQ